MTGIQLQLIIGHPLGMALPAQANVMIIPPGGASTTSVSLIGANQPPGPVTPPVVT